MDELEQEEKKPVVLETFPVESSNLELSHSFSEICSRIPGPDQNMTLNDSVELKEEEKTVMLEATPAESSNFELIYPSFEISSRIPSPAENITPNDSIQFIEEIEIDDDTMPYTPPNYSDNTENSNSDHAVENNETDDDFCIVYENIVSESEVQFIEYRQVCTATQSSYNRNRLHNSVSPCVSSISGPNADVTDAGNWITASNNALTTDSDDDCVAIEIITPFIKGYAIDNNQLPANQLPVLEDAESKKRKKIECGVCFDGPDDIASDGRNLISTVCGHIFCSECIKAAIKSTKLCPQCRKKLTMKQFHPLYI